MSDDHRPPIERVQSFLETHHAASVDALEPIRGGFWSSAYRYDVDGEPLVLRLGAGDEGYRMDRAAEAFRRPGLPVPEVLTIGTAFDGYFSVSRRHEGRFLEEVAIDEVHRIRPLLDELLASLRSVDVPPADGVGVEWFGDSSGASSSWRGWLEDALRERSTGHMAGWRERLREVGGPNRVFEQASSRLGELVPLVPERRDLIHGDLLHQNVLVADDLSAVNGVFSWKCSVLGDHVYEVATCTFWEPWHPAIAAADPLERMVEAGVDGDDLADAARRHHCYELHIGAHHLGWCAWNGDDESLAGVTDRTAAVLARGPLSV